MKAYQIIIASLVVVANFAWSQVNINTATVQELTALSGIGEKKAKAIVKYRKTNGQFTSVSDLVNVKGIGEKTVANLGKNIKTSGKTNLDKLTQTKRKKAKPTNSKNKASKKPKTTSNKKKKADEKKTNTQKKAKTSN